METIKQCKMVSAFECAQCGNGAVLPQNNFPEICPKCGAVFTVDAAYSNLLDAVQRLRHYICKQGIYQNGVSGENASDLLHKLSNVAQSCGLFCQDFEKAGI